MSGALAILDEVVSELAARGSQQARDEPAPDTLDAWWSAVRPATANWAEPVDRAIARGARADRIAYAFAAGYQAALRRLVPELADDAMVSLCITEAKGNHPRAIETRLTPDPASCGFRMSGEKRWATGSPQAIELLVAARAGERSDGRPEIKLARVRGGAPGLVIEPMHGIAFVPEIAHGRVTLDDVMVAASDVLPGDGYERYVKPFRTIEDAHVAAALGAHLLALAFRFGWPREVRERLLAHLVAARALAVADPGSGATHLALAGLFAEQGRLLLAIEPCWELADPATRARWERDSALLSVAGTAREKRREVAWNRLENR